MAGARGVVSAKVAGVDRRLRFSLAAVDAIETRLGRSLSDFFNDLKDTSKVRFGHILLVFSELCAAGGTPLSDEDVAVLLPSDLSDIMHAIAEASRAAGLEDGDSGKPQKASRPRGGAGKK